MDYEKYLKERGGKDYEWGLTSDGWNERDFEETGLMEWIDEIQELSYEIKNARRGSFAGFGDDTQDLYRHLKQLGRDLNSVIRSFKRSAEMHGLKLR